MRYLLFFTAFVGLGLSHAAHARLATESEMSFLIERNDATYDVKKDGTYTMDVTIQIAILAEAGRESQAVKSITFNSRASKFELLSAKTINDDVEIPVASTNIEIRETGDSKAFDSTKEAVISFPAVRVGSRVAYHYRLKVHEVPFDGFFSMGAGLNFENVDLQHRLIRSDLPLYIFTDDKAGLMKIESRRDGSRYVMEITNREKARYEVIQEESSYADSARLPTVLISTLPTWEGFAQNVLLAQEKLLKSAAQAPLPPVFEKIREAAAKAPPEKRIATVAAMTAKELRYFGDWRRRNGGHIPRSLTEIAQTGYGDCKDMSLVVVAITRALGLKADVAWLWRSENFLDDGYYKLPTDFSFNHAIARVETSEGHVEWVDATNSVAIPGIIFVDISNRPVLVMSAAGVRMERTPGMTSSETITRTNMSLHAKKDGRFEVKGDLYLTGRSASRASAAMLYMSRPQFQYETLKWIAQNEKLENEELEFPKEVNRVVSDLRLQYRFILPELSVQTTAGVGFPLLRNEVIEPVFIDVRDRFTDVWLGTPRVIEENFMFPDAQVVGARDIGCNLKNEWVNLSRSARGGAKGVEIRSRYEVLKSVIPSSAVRSKEFAAFQAKARRCFYRSVVILSSKPLASRSN